MFVYVCVCLWWPSIYLGCIHGFHKILEFNQIQTENVKKKITSLWTCRLSPHHYLAKNTVRPLLASIYMHCIVLGIARWLEVIKTSV